MTVLGFGPDAPMLLNTKPGVPKQATFQLWFLSLMALNNCLDKMMTGNLVTNIMNAATGKKKATANAMSELIIATLQARR